MDHSQSYEVVCNCDVFNVQQILKQTLQYRTKYSMGTSILPVVMTTSHVQQHRHKSLISMDSFKI